MGNQGLGLSIGGKENKIDYRSDINNQGKDTQGQTGIRIILIALVVGIWGIDFMDETRPPKRIAGTTTKYGSKNSNDLRSSLTISSRAPVTAAATKGSRNPKMAR